MPTTIITHTDKEVVTGMTEYRCRPADGVSVAAKSVTNDRQSRCFLAIIICLLFSVSTSTCDAAKSNRDAIA